MINVLTKILNYRFYTKHERIAATPKFPPENDFIKLFRIVLTILGCSPQAKIMMLWLKKQTEIWQEHVWGTFKLLYLIIKSKNDIAYWA